MGSSASQNKEQSKIIITKDQEKVARYHNSNMETQNDLDILDLRKEKDFEVKKLKEMVLVYRAVSARIRTQNEFITINKEHFVKQVQAKKHLETEMKAIRDGIKVLDHRISVKFVDDHRIIIN